MKNILLFLFITFFSLSISAQILPQPKTVPIMKDSTNADKPEDYTVGDVKGTINNKAIFLAKPTYSPEAREAGAEGMARVQITINEEGNVVAATMTEGNPLFKASAEDAAKRSRFRIARDAGGVPMQTNGFLTYNFVVQKAGWSRIAHSLSLLDRMPVRTFSIYAAKKSLAPEWTNELEMLKKLEEIRRAEPALPSSPFADVPKLAQMNSSSGSFGSTSSTVVRRLILPNPPSAEQIALAQNLITALQARLGNDELALWQFNLGLEIRRAMETQRNPDTRSEAAQIIRQKIEFAPSKVSPEVIAALQNLAQSFEKTKRAMESANEIGKNLSIIFNAK